jgi:hypothetical protein
VFQADDLAEARYQNPETNLVMTNTAKPSITELISLLDPETLNALTARLHRVAEGHETPVDPQQLLLGIIDDAFQAYEEDMSGDAATAEALLQEIEAVAA